MVDGQVQLNGHFLLETDAVSLFLDGLGVGSTNTVSVAATGPDGVETEPRHVEFRTIEEPGSAASPCQIYGLTGSVYSATAAEIFWDRQASGTRNELFLDGEFLFNTDAVQYRCVQLVSR